MDQIEKIVECISPVLEESNVALYEVKWTNQGKNKVLQIAIMHEDGTMDLETCATVSEKISEVLDAKDMISFEYFLEICSPGAERKLRSHDEIVSSTGKHVYVRFKKAVKSMNDVTGDLEKVDGNELTIAYRDKAAVRRVTFDENNIDLIRLAVKL
ncbi:MAG: ribosome maturation factor RimP [Erysipelotrichaceae bacterium]|nr:ribosome maturation factor RimP [Erysipelotrichaceae bacterium]